MKNSIFLLFAFLILSAVEGSLAFAQTPNPAKATFSVKHPVGLDSGATAIFEVKLEPNKGWHIYSAEPSDEGVYKPTEIEFDINSRGFDTDAKISEEGLLMKEYDDIMGGMMRYYKSPVIFSQKIKINSDEVILIGTVDYMACDDQKCLVFTEKFEIKPE